MRILTSVPRRFKAAMERMKRRWRYWQKQRGLRRTRTNTVPIRSPILRRSMLTRFRSAKALKLVLILFLVLGWILWLVFRSSWFALSSVEVKITEEEVYLSSKDVQAYLNGTALGKTRLLLPLTTLAAELNNQFPSILAVRLSRRLPSALLVEASVRQPVLQIISSDSGERFVIDQTGYVFSLSHSDNLARVTVTGSLVLKDYLSGEKIAFVLALLQSFGEVKPSDIKFSEGGVVQIELDQMPVFFSLRRPVNVQIEEYKEVKRRYQQKGISLKRIDLRFDRPVVRY